MGEAYTPLPALHGCFSEAYLHSFDAHLFDEFGEDGFVPSTHSRRDRKLSQSDLLRSSRRRHGSFPSLFFPFIRSRRADQGLTPVPAFVRPRKERHRHDAPGSDSMVVHVSMIEPTSAQDPPWADRRGCSASSVPPRSSKRSHWDEKARGSARVRDRNRDVGAPRWRFHPMRPTETWHSLQRTPDQQRWYPPRGTADRRETWDPFGLPTIRERLKGTVPEGIPLERGKEDGQPKARKGMNFTKKTKGVAWRWMAR